MFLVIRIAKFSVCNENFIYQNYDILHHDEVISVFIQIMMLKYNKKEWVHFRFEWKIVLRVQKLKRSCMIIKS